ncbi:cysteine-rich protein 2-binding protein [Plodia interpunctella]|uniref:cysteine-rich protein 2-binding protein n=1 Tax=Plodia interpunctella TaxID=58824 RepID=UPI0023675DB3|nr:cysteine-rich protein 2-binding protein [Plodia interpunctella]
MSVCKYCEELENKQDKPGLVCKTCLNFVHLSCLRRPGTPGDFACDVFFDFVCEDCTPERKELFKRNKFPWVNVILLTLHHLNWHSYGISNHGFFHYKTHICSFIDRYWHQLFGGNIKQKKNWVGTIAGVLSIYNNIVFRSGSVALGETGWWKLMHGFSPAVAAHIVQELARDKPKGRPRNQMSLDMTLFVAKVTEMGYKDLINNDDLDNMPLIEPAKKRRLDYEATSSMSNTSHYELVDSDSRNEVGDECSYDEMDFKETSFRGFEFANYGHVAPQHSDSSSIHSLTQVPYYDSDSRSRSPTFTQPELTGDRPEKVRETKPKKDPEENVFVKRDSLFSTQLNSVDLPWIEKLPEKREDLVELTQYEEVQLLKQVEGLSHKVADPCGKARLRRLAATLRLRRLKRHKQLPIFELDKRVKVLGGYVTEDTKVIAGSERVLDRFQRSSTHAACGTVWSGGGGGGALLSAAHAAAAPGRAALSAAPLRPYIRRDAAAAPLWLRLTDELLRKANKNVPGYEPPPHATLDYSYVRPQHIAAVNDLCAQHFWPGIDLTEALQYPEFSCVVTYKRLVVACAFLVPDAGHNEAYISFILTRPEWRKAKIGTFMLYHLLQTCSGKDVTLHVSPTNPAIFLYQKFGFKVEELIQDFYEKYYDIEYKGCRHALFLRLIR